jgi:O-methyltransferase
MQQVNEGGGRDSRPLSTTVKQSLMPFFTRFPRLMAGTSRLYYTMDRRFRTLSNGAPSAIRRALAEFRNLGAGPGDYYEFGVFRGYTLWTAHEAVRDLGLDRTHLYGFDSFEGLPQLEELDRTGNRFFGGQFAASERQVREELTAHGVDWNKVSLIPGFYSDVLTDELKSRHSFNPVAVAFIDCDLYASTRDVLRWLTSLIGDRCFLLFDDWTSFGSDPGLGQPRALAEFQAARPEFAVEPWFDFEPHGKAFTLTRMK